jgi:hypothetical protein
MRNNSLMVSFNLKSIPDDIWKKWKKTVPRDKTLENAIIELLKKEGDRRGKNG